MTEHVITRDQPTHNAWDATLEPVLEVEPGDVVIAETDDFAGGQITRDSTAADLLDLLVAAGHSPRRIHAERFGGTG
jgi:acetamidase/formamidase